MQPNLKCWIGFLLREQTGLHLHGSELFRMKNNIALGGELVRLQFTHINKNIWYNEKHDIQLQSPSSNAMKLCVLLNGR